jgi:3-oxoacyl-[acyl-carrier protein] reductase
MPDLNDKTRLDGKVALVTGSARGIGKTIAERFAALGADVAMNYSRDRAGAEKTAGEIEASGANVIAVQADVAEPASLEQLFSAALDRFGKLDIVVANAGVEMVEQPVVDFTEADFDRMFSVNAKGTFFTLQLAAKHIADRGRIIYVGTSNTRYPLPGHGLYGGSKLAAQFLVEVLAKEIGSREVTVNSILPTATSGAGVHTDNVREEVMEFVRSFRPIPRMGTPDDVADAAEYLASDLGSFVSGQHLLLSGGAPA